MDGTGVVRNRPRRGGAAVARSDRSGVVGPRMRGELVETEISGRRSRRAVLGAAIGGAAALAATTVTRPIGVQAADGDNALIGAVNEGTAVTVFENQDAAATSLEGRHVGDGTGVSGTSFTGRGIEARATQMDPLVMGSNTTALWAVTGSAAGVAANTSETGVYGYADTSG